MVAFVTFPTVHVSSANSEEVCYPTVYVDPATYTATTSGEIFTVSVGIANVSNLQGFEFKLGYDNAILGCFKAVEGSFLRGFGATLLLKTEVDETLGRVWVAIVLLGTTPAEGDGILATISFECIAAGECIFDLYDTKLGDPTATPIDHYVTDGYSVDEFVDPPIAMFTWKPIVAAVDEPVVFDASSSMGGVSFDWNFGDGQVANGQIVTHSYASPATYTVTLKVTDSEGQWNLCQHWIQIQLVPGDFNGDGSVDELDAAILAAHFNQHGLPGWIPEDLRADGIIDIFDAIILANLMGQYDKTPPVTQIYLDGTLGTNGWYVSDVVVSLTAYDSGSGVDKTECSFDTTTWVVYTNSFVISTEGTTILYYRSIDKKGNQEQTKSQTINIDKGLPGVVIYSPQLGDYPEGSTLTISYEATDSTSGIASANASIGYDPATIYVDPNVRNAAVGEDIRINVSIVDASNVIGIGFRLNWDPTILTGVSIVIPEDHFMNPDGHPENLWILKQVIYTDYAEYTVTYQDHLQAIADGYAPKNGSGTLAMITLHAVDAGTSFMHINETKMADADANPIEHDVVDGLVTVNAAPENHDIAVTSVTALPTTVTAGDSVTIDVVVENQGTRTETFDVSVLYDSTLISSEAGVILDWGASATLTFIWNTAGIHVGAYRITAQASVVPGEGDTADNTYSNGLITVRMPVENGQTLDLSGWQIGKYNFILKAVDNAGNVAEDSVVFSVIAILSGVVTDEYTMQPIMGIVVNVLETGESAITDSQGRFSFTIRTTGLYTVEMTLPYECGTHDNFRKIVEVTKTAEVDFTLFSWDYIFEDTYGSGTTLKLNTAHNLLQFITPEKDYGVRTATFMKVTRVAIVIRHLDSQLKLNTASVDTKHDFCEAQAWDLLTGKYYVLLDKPGIE
jgi:hypothetical protein